MDDVPVKIVERYKPPPIVYQLPQTVASKLAQGPNYYNENPQFAYDFQLERNVLTQMQCWRQVRQREREARQERMERRKQERQRAIEAQQKEMLGAVQYPSAEELSSSSSLDSEEEGDDDGSCLTTARDENESRATKIEATAAATKSETADIAAASGLRDESEVKKSINSTQTSNFHNILQPTVLSPQFMASASSNYGLDSQTTKETLNASNHTNVLFNYADFEYDNSSPFDNMELKTINDLDILAQVLHNTQLKEAVAPMIQENLIRASHQPEQVVSTEDNSMNSATLAENKAVLEKIDFNSLNQCDDVVNIPKNNTNSAQPEQTPSNNYNVYHMYSSPSQTFQQQQQQHQQINTIQAFHMQQTQMPAMTMASYLTQYDYRQQQQSPQNVPTTTAYNNQNYLLTPYCNGQPQHTTHNYITHHGTPTHNTQTSNVQYLTAQSVAPTDAESAALKSKSVPDILRELKSELLSSEQRRSRNLSHNLDDNVQSRQEVTNSEAPSLPKSVYTELSASARKLADSISSMGFPLERVAKVVHVCGVDDKKIIEHLIPLSELMDLGFDESKISAALFKFNNNKDKALDYLIS